MSKIHQRAWPDLTGSHWGSMALKGSIVVGNGDVDLVLDVMSQTGPLPMHCLWEIRLGERVR